MKTSKTSQRAAGLCLAIALLAGCGGGGGDGDAAGDGGDPPAALSLVAVGSSARTVSLAWRPAAGASGYTVERRTGHGAYAPIANLGADAIHFLDDGLEPNTAYTYRLGVAGSDRRAEQSATTGDAVAIATGVPALHGAPRSRTLGAAGGRVASADGSVVVEVPAGALAGDTELQLQPTANPVPDGHGDGVLLRVAGDLARPLTLRLPYAAVLDANADGLGVAVQRADGSWLSLPLLAVDKERRMLTVRLDAPLVAQDTRPAGAAAAAAAASVSLHFYLVTYQNFYLSPREATVDVGRTREFVPYARTKGVIGHICTPDEDFGCLPYPLIGSEKAAFENSKPGYARKWYVFAEEGGTAALGTVTPSGTVGATYQAPDEVPEPNPVIVSFESVHTKTSRRVWLSAKVTVKAPVWTGTVSGVLSVPQGDLGFRFTAEGVWTPVAGSQGTRYTATGTQTLSVIPMGCTGTVSPATVALPPGALVIDDSTTPARYSLDVGSVWRSALTGSCPGHGSATVAFDVPGRLVVDGTLTRNGTTLEGFAALNGIAWDWALTRQP
jgi:hypothetical protein